MAGRSFQECAQSVMDAGKMGKDAALNLLSQVYDRAELMKAKRVADPYMKAVADIAFDMQAQAKAARLDALRNAATRAEITARTNAEAEGRIAPGVSANLNPTQTKLTLADGLRSILHYMPGANRKDNVESMWLGLSKQLISPIGNRLRQLGLEKAAIADGMRHEIAEAMWRANGGVHDPSVTISKNAQAIADAFMAPLRLVKERQNALGATIGDAVDYVTHTNWDSRQLRRAAGPGATRDAAYAAWKARDVPRMAEKTFDGIIPRDGETPDAARERFIRSIYDATESGVHKTGTEMAGMAADDNGFVPPLYEGTHNIARSASQQRVVYWKNARAWSDHMREFGGGESLYSNVARTLDVGARRTGLMHYLGTNPEANFETVARRLIETHRTSDELGRLQQQLQGVRNVLGRLTGSLNVPIREDATGIIDHLLSAEAMMHLGGVSLTHLAAAPATFSSEMVHHGVSRFETLANIAKGLTMNRGTAEAQEALADAGAYTHGYHLGLQRLAGTGVVKGAASAWERSGAPGFISWASANFMRLTGLPQIIDSLQAHAVKSVLMDRLGRETGHDFGAIEPHQQAGLNGYGIGPEEWDLIRGASDPSLVQGRRWVTPSDALNSDAGAVETLLRNRGQLGDKASAETIDRAVNKFQWGLGDKLLMYLNDAGDRAIVRPGVRERAIMLQGLRPGTPMHALARAVGQFKMWPLAAATQILGRDIATSLSRKEMATNLGALFALSAIGGAIRMSVNDLATGRPQRDYRNPWTWLAALGQGGGLGIYGDFLFGETSRMGAGLTSTMLGPVASDADRFWQLFTRWKADMATEPGKAMQHMWPDLAHLVASHVPFANLVYLKGALDYLLWYHLFEAASPGWWERTNRRFRQETGRTMVGYRPGGHIPWTPFGEGQ